MDLYAADSLQTERTSLKAPNGSTTDLSNFGPDVEQTYGNGHIFNICSISAPWGTNSGGIVAEVKDASMKPLDGKALCPSALALFTGGARPVS